MKTLWAVACAALAVAAMLTMLFATAMAASESSEVGGGGSSQPAATASVTAAPLTSGTASQEPAKNSGSVNPVAAAGPQYRIGPEDMLKVSVWENKELTLDVVVRPDGKISVPLIQDVQAEGLTAAEIADVIHQRLLGFIKDPQVSVIVIQVNAPKIFVIGSVAKPGPYLLRSDMSILQALSMAGGFTQFASPRSIKLVRGTGVKQEVRKINYYNLIDDGGEGNYLLKPGDTIVVP